MNKLIEKLVLYIERQVAPAIIASGGGDLRIEFLGPPRAILREILDYFMALGGISVEVNGTIRSVPVYLLDDVAINPAGINGGLCTDAHLTHVRNSVPYLLALIPPHTLANKSIDTSTTQIGVPQLLEAHKWRQYPLIQDLIKEALASKACEFDVIENYIDHILGDAERLDEHLNDRTWQWKILEVLLNIDHPTGGGHDQVVAACGLPRAFTDKNSLQSAKQIINTIVDKMMSEGLLSFFQRLSESVESTFMDQQDLVVPVRLAIEEFKVHLLSQIDSAPGFESAPHIRYSPYRTCGYTSLPDWWKTLSVDVWRRLLEEEDKPDEDLNITLENVLFQPKKGHPCVVKDVPSFRVEPTKDKALPRKVIVERGIGARTPTFVGDIDTNVTISWADNGTPPAHDKSLRYRFSVPGGDLGGTAIRVISLESFVPGVVIDSRAAKKVTPLKKAKGTTSRRAIWDCDLTLQGKGMQHHFDVYFNSKTKIADNVRFFNSNGKLLLEEHFQVEHTGKNQVIIELPEEGYLELAGTIDGQAGEFVVRARVHLEDIEASGVGSWFEKLVELHMSSSSFETRRIDVTWSKSQQLSKWILDHEDSYYPLVMGYDYRENWKCPQWDSLPIMSKYRFSNDIRPGAENFKPPDKLLECREAVRSLINKDDGVIELVNLGELAENPDNLVTVAAYMEAYSEWLEKDRDNALWFDVVVVMRPEATNSVLSQQPDAMLLNPMHPVRIGWQFFAQSVLYSSLVRQKHCPAAGVLDPRSTPDCVMLPCWTAGQQIQPAHFISVASTSDYWAVLWNGKATERLNDECVGIFFDETFGIKLDGIAAGFTVSQVGRALNDIAMIRSARVCLKVRLIDDTIGSSSCTNGITEWSSENLGEKDRWFSAGATSLEVYDARSRLQWPSARIVANLTDDTLARARWFAGDKNNDDSIDLTIINHLGSTNPDLAKHEIPSAIGEGALIRQRVRRQLPTQTGNQFVSESRKSPPRQRIGRGLSDMIEYLSWQLENTCDDIDSYVFAPKMMKIRENLKKSKYCAVSSTIIDPSCFFDTDKNIYLWDYDIPAYARRAGNNNGYYLIASETAAILQAVQTNLGEIAPSGHELSDDMIRLILREVTGRGFPTLKRLVIQGATSTGEIGLLVALRILQSQKTTKECLFPLAEARHVNLVIPIDPFKNMITDLKLKLGMSGSRPDILAVSVYYHEQRILIKFTPIEVKHRSGFLSEGEKRLALGQASEFSSFLAAMELLANDESVWRVALTGLLATMIDFGFRTASVARGMGKSKEWAEIHSGTLQALMSGKAEREVDYRGRLIVIDQSTSNLLDLDNDKFTETLVVQTSEAFKIVVSEGVEIMNKIKASLQNWGLLATLVDNDKHTPLEMTEKTTGGLAGTPTDEKETIQVEESIHGIRRDEEEKGIYFAVGKDITSPFHDPEVYAHPSNTELNHLNIGIVGDLGTGKTQLTKSLIYKFVNSYKGNRGFRPKFLIFDYKGDYLDRQFIDVIGGRVVEPYRIPLNLFDISGKESANPIIDTASFFNDVIGKIYKVEKPNQQFLLKAAIKDCYGSLSMDNGVHPSIYDVYKAYQAKLNGKVDSTLSILSDIVDRELFEHNTSGVKPFKEFFDRTVVINLKSLGQNDSTKNMLVVIFLHLFYDHMLTIEKKTPIGDKLKLRFIDSMLLVDEANSIMKYNFDVLKTILLQGREFGVGVLLASQYLSHFYTQQNNYAEPLLTWFIHKVPNITKKEMESIGFVDVNTDIIERIKSLKIHECIYKSFDTPNKGKFIYGYPFYKSIGWPLVSTNNPK